MLNSHSAKTINTNYMSIADADQTGLDLIGDLSFEAYVRWGSLHDIWGFVYKWALPGADRSYRWLYDSAATAMKFDINNDTEHAVSDPWTPSVDTWYRLAMAYASGAGIVKFYVDGIDIGTASNNCIGAINSGASIVQIGYADTEHLIDDVRIWSDVRTPAELLANKDVELDGDEAGLEAYWPFNGNLLDKTANLNHLSALVSKEFSSIVPFGGGTIIPVAAMIPEDPPGGIGL